MKQIAELLRDTRVIAVVGLSSRPWRASYGVSEYMQSAGYRVIPVNPREKEVLGEPAYSRLEDVPVPIDMVNIFRRSEFVPEIVEAAIRVRAKSVWMQEGVVHEAAAQRAREGWANGSSRPVLTERTPPALALLAEQHGKQVSASLWLGANRFPLLENVDGPGNNVLRLRL